MMHFILVAFALLAVMLVVAFIATNETCVETIVFLLLTLQERLTCIWRRIPVQAIGPIYQNLVKNLFDIIWPWLTWLLVLPPWILYKRLQRLWRQYQNDTTQVVDVSQQIKELQNDVALLKNDFTDLKRKRTGS